MAAGQCSMGSCWSRWWNAPHGSRRAPPASHAGARHRAQQGPNRRLRVRRSWRGAEAAWCSVRRTAYDPFIEQARQADVVGAVALAAGNQEEIPVYRYCQLRYSNCEHRCDLAHAGRRLPGQPCDYIMGSLRASEIGWASDFETPSGGSCGRWRQDAQRLARQSSAVSRSRAIGRSVLTP